MISDVLSDAIADIEEYQANDPASMYQDAAIKDKIAHTLAVMRELLRELDS